MKYSPKSILDAVQSIQQLYIVEGELEAEMVYEPLRTSIHAYQPGSFTRELLELIDKHIEREP